MFKNANVDVQGADLKIGVPVNKIDKENRIVSGWATLNNVDSQKDMITHEANMKAFANTRARIREQHTDPVGKLVSFKEDTLIVDGKEYRGIYVDCYISKGAESTWQKVLDGTLAGFSIGGHINKKENVLNSDNTVTKVILDYRLDELSLVDNPANPLSNITSFLKSVDGTIEMAAVENTNYENVFYCEKDEIAKTSNSDEDKPTCVSCGRSMTKVGWFEWNEKPDNESIVKTVSSIVHKHLKEKEGGVKNMTNQEKEVEVNELGEVAQTEAKNEEKVEVAENETGAVAVDIEKLLEEFRAELLAQMKSNSDERIDSMQKSIDAMEKSVSSVVDASAKTNESLATLSDDVSEVKASGAFKKSIDSGESRDDSKKESLWGGSFISLKTDDEG